MLHVRHRYRVLILKGIRVTPRYRATFAAAVAMSDAGRFDVVVMDARLLGQEAARAGTIQKCSFRWRGVCCPRRPGCAAADVAFVSSRRPACWTGWGE